MPRSKKTRRRSNDGDRLSVAELNALEPAMVAFREKAENDPKGLAADFIEMAWEEPDEELARTFALDALKLDPLCSDALLLLSDLAADDAAQMELVEAAVRMAEEAMGENPFERLRGRFGTAPEAQPYLRARCLLADLHMLDGRFAQAMEHFWAVIDLWPDEAEGIRSTMLLVLFRQDDLDGIERLLRRYADERSAIWAYAWALLSFRRDGAGLVAHGHLMAALAANPFVPDYLLGKRTLPKTRPAAHRAGDRSEAQILVHDFAPAWRGTAGALDWLRKSLPSRS